MTMAMCSPDTDSRCARPEFAHRGEVGGGDGALPAGQQGGGDGAGGARQGGRGARLDRGAEPGQGRLSVPGATVARPMAKPLPPRPEKKAARWKS